MPKISVIVPVYKAESYLPGCIDSILSQTYSDFEVILVDDGSPDNCLSICRDYAKKDSRVTVLHQENRGQAAARNHALTIAKGEWLCFVDSDDAVHPQMLALLYSAAEESGAAISMCRMLEAPELPGDFTRSYEAEFELLTMDEETLVRLHDNEEYPAWVACAKLVRRELVESYPFREGRVFEDNEAVCRWVCQGKTLARMMHPLYYYRTNPGSTTKSSFNLKKLDYLWALESIIRHYTALGYSQMRQRFLNRYADAAVSCCYGARYMLNRPDVARQVERSVRRFLKEENAKLTRPQFEALLDAAHPKLIKLYWPVSGVIRILKEQGISGIVAKIANREKKGDA